MQEKVVICQHLNIANEALNDKYLGVPAMLGVDRSDSFEYLIDRINQLVIGSQEKLFSSGGKETLIKAVSQAMPVFAMSVFKIPKKICKGMMITTSIYIELLGGKFVCQRIEEGWGLGIYIALILPYLPSKFGGCWRTPTPFVRRS